MTKRKTDPQTDTQSYSIAPLDPGQLRRSVDPASLIDIEPTGSRTDPLIGQERAVGAIRFGSAIRKPGFNIYAMGQAGSGRHTAVHALLEERAAAEPTPRDWVYVFNFAEPDKPRALDLPPGRGLKLGDAMEVLIDDLSAAVPALFESDDYKSRRSAIEQDAEDTQERALSAIGEKARSKSIAIMRTPAGFAFAPMKDGQVIKPDVFEAMAAADRTHIEADIRALQEELKDVLEQMPAVEKSRRDRIRTLNEEMATGAVDRAIAPVLEAFADLEPVAAYLGEAAEDLVANVEIFLEAAAEAANAALPVGPPSGAGDARFGKYTVNVIVGNGADGEETGAPVVFEPNPTLTNLVGRIDHIAQMGTLTTDFTLIKPGALHRANGGYLILDIREVLLQAFAWESLKRCLKSGDIAMTTPAEQMSLVSTTSLTPDTIPLDIKIVLIGDRLTYYLLMAYDPDFAELFKVEADFEDDFDRSPENVRLYARLIRAIADEDGLRPLDTAALARMIDEAVRLAEDAEKLSLRVGTVADILREADHWAGSGHRETIGPADIAKAVAERHRRSARISELNREAIARNIVLIDTDGAVTGQVNALSVIQIGAQSFGRPSRITARVRMGAGKIIDIEREVELGGALHSKGVLILSSFLAARYAPDIPVSLHASLVFEQSYGGIDGDSASSTELYALLSVLADAPIRQSLAVTGSVNQFGQVQAIGGVNDKIEGFFDVCAGRGLTGRQGVLIPAANVKHLMLREDVVEACRAGRFGIYPVSTIDQGITQLTGIAAGERGADGRFPPDSINGRVEARLVAYAEARRRFGRDKDGENANVPTS